MEFGPLRQHILQLAVSGQLVEQLDSEPAVEQVGPAPKPDEVPFELPPKWKWVQIGTLIPFGESNQVTPDQIPPKSWLLGLEEIRSNGGLIYKRRDWNEAGSNKNSFQAGNVLYSKMRPYLNKAIIADEAGFCSTELLVLDINQSKAPLTAEYLLYFLRSPYFVEFATKHSHGQKPRLDLKVGRKAWMALPSIEEQRRIVTAVDNLMGRLDQMEAAYSEFAGPMTEHFRNLMLDKAIKGELVPQLDSEPEVEQVGPAPKPDEVLFELPPKWKWVQAEHLGSWKSGQTPRRSNKRFWEQGTIPWLKSGEITDGLIYDIGEKVTAQAVNECNIRLNPSGSVVVALYGATAGKVGILQDSCVTNQACCVCIVNSDLAINWYLFYALLAIREMLLNKTAGSAQPNLSKEKVIATWIPVPPLEEQRRIVAKLEEVFAGVEKLGSLMEYA